MRKRIIPRILVTFLAVLLLAGCAPEPVIPPTMEPDPTVQQTAPEPTEAPEEYPLYYFPNMTYTHPDMDGATQLLEECMELAQGDNFFALMDSFKRFNQLYSDYSTSYVLARIHYSQDVRDPYWKEELDHCTQSKAALDAGCESLLRKMANGPFQKTLSGDDYFGSSFVQRYTGESQQTEVFTALKQEEARLVSEYYTLMADVPMDEHFLDNAYPQLAELLVELVKVRQSIAREAGYERYVDYAYGVTYNRDFSADGASEYLSLLRRHLAPLYMRYYDEQKLQKLTLEQTEQQTYDYLERFTNAAGDPLRKVFEIMTNGALYDITISDKKINSSYTINIPKYQVPFLFVHPTGTNMDSTVFTHEFGHFCKSYAGNAAEGIDMAEFYSQAMEYLSLCYTDGELREQMMYSSLGTYVQTAGMADFELRLYDMSPEELTADNVLALFQTVLRDFSGDDPQFAQSIDSRSFVTYTHFFDQPLYIISYVVSNDAAMQVYELEQKEPGSGLKLYTELITTKQVQFMGFIQEAQLKSPFSEERVKETADFFKSYFGE